MNAQPRIQYGLWSQRDKIPFDPDRHTAAPLVGYGILNPAPYTDTTIYDNETSAAWSLGEHASAFERFERLKSVIASGWLTGCEVYSLAPYEDSIYLRLSPLSGERYRHELHFFPPKRQYFNYTSRPDGYSTGGVIAGATLTDDRLEIVFENGDYSPVLTTASSIWAMSGDGFLSAITALKSAA